MSEVAFARVSLLDACIPARSFTPMRARNESMSVTPPELEPEPQLDPVALGFAEGERVAAAAFAEERTELLRLVAGATALQPEPSEELAAMIATTVERLVTELVGVMPVGPGWLTDRIDRAMACIAEADAARTLWLHPEDVALLGDARMSIDVQVDETLERGALRIDCSRGWIEDSRSVHLDALRATLGIEARS